MLYLIAFLWSLPWIIPPLVTWFRLRNSRSLDNESDIAPPDSPLVSVIVPARNEAHNIARCVSSILATTYPNLEVIVVDDSSTDGTAEIAREAAAGDRRLRVVVCPPLPDLVTRSINAMRRARAQLFSVAGHQELGGFWEKVIQPQVFTILSMRYGGTESVTRATSVANKIANGQCIFVTHDSYNAIGGHSSVRTSVAEDLMLAQKFFAARKRVVLMLGVNQLSTRMYASLGEIIDGWRKNVFAGGLDTVPFGRIGRTMFPLFLLMPPLMELLPPLALLFAASGVPTGPTVLVWAAISCAATLIWWVVVYVTVRENPLYALAYPLGALLLLYIFLSAVIRGRRVSWKGRTYISQ
jgi:chlorobactene glucosyltransferase